MIMLCVAAVLCIISDAVLLYIMVRSSQNEKLREELRIKDYQNALNLEYYKNVENSSNEVRKIRHDLANIIQTAYEVVHSGNGKSTAKRPSGCSTSSEQRSRI